MEEERLILLKEHKESQEATDNLNSELDQVKEKTRDLETTIVELKEQK